MPTLNSDASILGSHNVGKCFPDSAYVRRLSQVYIKKRAVILAQDGKCIEFFVSIGAIRFALLIISWPVGK